LIEFVVGYTELILTVFVTLFAMEGDKSVLGNQV